MLKSMGEWLIMLRGHRRIFISVAEKKKAKKKQGTAAIGGLTPESKPRKTPHQ
jgi:hypothetical protein